MTDNTAVTPLGVIIVNYGPPDLIAANFGQVDLSQSAVIVVVVDNFRCEADRTAIENYCNSRGWNFVPVEANIGFGSAANLGAKHAFALGCVDVLVLNPDATVSPSVLAALAESARENPTTLVSPRILRPDGSSWFVGSQVDPRSGRLRRKAFDGPSVDRTHWLTGACLLVPGQVWRRIGGFAEDFFLYWEDVDLSRRWISDGGTVQVRSDLVAVHEVGGTQAGTAKSADYYFYNCRNRLVYAASNLGRADIARWVLHTPVESLSILLRGGRANLLRSPSTWYAGIIGSIAGVGVALKALVRRRTRRPSRAADGGKLIVLQSFPDLRATSNPFLKQLLTSLPPEVEPMTFTWRRALRGRYDVFHMHWPELLARGSSPGRAALRQVMYVLLLLRIRRRGTAVVRTVHNLVPHEEGRLIERRILQWVDRLTTLRIELNDSSVPSEGSGRNSTVILHGHYRDWFSPMDCPEPQPGRVLYFGLIRRYKNVARLLEVVSSIADPELSLRVIGKPGDLRIRAEIEAAIAKDSRTSGLLEYVGDPQLAAEVGAAEIVVLPYVEMYNSGAAILALSLNRPIVVPATPANAALAAEVGHEWVFTYDGELSSDNLVICLKRAAAAASDRGRRSPDLSRRNWDVVAAAHRSTYADAVRLATSAKARRQAVTYR